MSQGKKHRGLGKKKLCARGHDIAVVGRHSNGVCKQCRIDYNKNRKTRIAPRKQFCINNHDTFICGRDKAGGCRECKREYQRKIDTKNRVIKHVKQFCVHGHDTFVTGRDKNNGCCIQCRRDREKRNYIPRKRKRKPFCVNGHEIAIVGRDKYGCCNACKKKLREWYDKSDKRKEIAKERRKQPRVKEIQKRWRTEHADDLKEYHKEQYMRDKENTSYSKISKDD